MATVLLEKLFMEKLLDFKENERKQITEFISKLNKDPSNSGISLERLNRNSNLWSGRVNIDIRAIIYKEGETFCLLYVDKHDLAYKWAERRSVKKHDMTGAFQVTLAVENVQEIVTINEKPITPMFQKYDNNYLSSIGIPDDWIPVVRHIYNEDDLLNVISKLPEDIGERLLRLGSGELVTPPAIISKEENIVKTVEFNPRFYLVKDDEDLLRVLSAPLEKWVTFLHPSQKKLAYGNFKGSVKITGSAGTGKTVVAMHRAKYLSSQGKKVLLTSYVTTLCDNIKKNLKFLCSEKELSNISVSTIHSYALDILKSCSIKAFPANSSTIKDFIEQFYRHGLALDLNGMLSEWETIIQPQAISTWEQYRDANRSGRGKALSAKDRKFIWDVFAKVLGKMHSKNMMDWSSICNKASELILSGKYKPLIDSVIVDEVQDLGVQELKFISVLVKDNPENLMIVGDGGQRIYSRKFSLKSVGIDIRGRSHNLNINYRTTRQIKNFADRVLGDEVDDLDEGIENRKGTISLLRGPEPILKQFDTQNAQYQYICEEIKKLLNQNLKENEIAIFARKNSSLDSVSSELRRINIKTNFLNENESTNENLGVNLGTMHRAKGLEFKVVFVIDSDNQNLPLSSVIRSINDPIEHKDILEKEKNLFYVSLTRARDEVYVTWTGEKTSFINN